LGLKKRSSDPAIGFIPINYVYGFFLLKDFHRQGISKQKTMDDTFSKPHSRVMKTTPFLEVP